jgi:hypothetical protein
VKTECRAQMKKAVTYKVDIAIDEHGSIDECQCECAVGMGPNLALSIPQYFPF